MISASLQQRKTRTRRSMLFVPGANAAMVSNSFIYPADALMFDLEDSVALREKDTARRMVYHALQHPLYRDIETIVRVNALEMCIRDRCTNTSLLPSSGVMKPNPLDSLNHLTLPLILDIKITFT